MTTVKEDRLNLVLNNGFIKSDDFTPADWEKIVHAAVAEVTLRFLKGWTALREIILATSADAWAEGDLLESTKILGVPGKLSVDTPFLLCANLTPKPTFAMRAPNASQRLLLSRKLGFFQLSVMWEDHKLHKNLCTASEVKLIPVALEKCFEGDSEGNIATEIIHSLLRAQRETVKDLSKKHEEAIEAASAVEGYLGRLGA